MRAWPIEKAEKAKSQTCQPCLRVAQGTGRQDSCSAAGLSTQRAQAAGGGKQPKMERKSIFGILVVITLLVLFGSSRNSTRTVQETEETSLFIVDGEIEGHATHNLHSFEQNMQAKKAHAEEIYLGKRIILDKSKGEKIGINGVLESSLPKGTRVLPPNSQMTMDYRPDRLNLMTDEDYIVKSVSFG
jgi:hypothetical protein